MIIINKKYTIFLSQICLLFLTTSNCVGKYYINNIDDWCSLLPRLTSQHQEKDEQRLLFFSSELASACTLWSIGAPPVMNCFSIRFFLTCPYQFSLFSQKKQKYFLPCEINNFLKISDGLRKLAKYACIFICFFFFPRGYLLDLAVIVYMHP